MNSGAEGTAEQRKADSRLAGEVVLVDAFDQSTPDDAAKNMLFVLVDDPGPRGVTRIPRARTSTTCG
jgi:hypothetical protein